MKHDFGKWHWTPFALGAAIKARFCARCGLTQIRGLVRFVRGLKHRSCRRIEKV